MYNFEYEPPSKKEIHSEYQNEFKKLVERLNKIENERNKLFEYIENIKIFEDKYYYSFKDYIDNKDLNDILVETIKDIPNIFPLYEDTERLLSYELLEVMGKSEKDLFNEKDNYFIQNLIKYMLLYKVNGGLINQWFKGLNKCLILI
jgi:ABC-type Zn uptake system ZnuABC Zn-binding protein ZnuA